MDLCTKKLGMQIELHRNNVYQGVELLLLVSMLFLLAIPKCLLIFKENFITLVYSHISECVEPNTRTMTMVTVDVTSRTYKAYGIIYVSHPCP